MLRRRPPASLLDMRIGTFKRRFIVEPVRLPVGRKDDERAPKHVALRRRPKRTTTTTL